MHELINCLKVAQLTKRSLKTIQLWVSTFKEGGIEGIDTYSPPRCPLRLLKDQMEELEKKFLTHTRNLGYDFNNWEGKNVIHQIKKKYHIKLKVRQM